MLFQRNTFFHACITDLRMVFRYPVDIGYKRTLNTPQSQHLMANMESFVESFVAKWKDAESNGNEILTENYQISNHQMERVTMKHCTDI